jgi:endonuclease-3
LCRQAWRRHINTASAAVTGLAFNFEADTFAGGRAEMPRETHEARTARVRRILAALHQTYPEAHCELNYSNPLELLVATILSAQCTDKQVNLVTADLFRRYCTAADYANAAPSEFEHAIRRIGLYRNKAKSVQAACRKLVECHHGEVPRTMEELVQLDGVGRKTANVVLGNAFGINVGVVVDTHVARLAQRLGLTRQNDPKKIELDLMKLVPQPDWTMLSHWLIWHGRRRCFARNPDCAECEVATLCPSVGRV